MDQSTWQDCKVQKVLLEQFVTLRLWHRSTDATHFAAMFPYSTVPCISVISYNGMLLKQLGGYAAPAELLSTLEQAITMQNTVAIVAALSSTSNESTPMLKESQTNRASNEPGCAESEMGGSSVMNNDSDTPAPATSRITSLDDNTSQPEHSASAQMHVLAAGASAETQEDIITPQIPVHTVGLLPQIPENRRRPQMDSGVCDVLAGAISSQDNVAPRALETLPKDPLAIIDTSVEPLEQKIVHPQIAEEMSKTKKSTKTFLLQVRLTNGKSIRKIFNPKDCLAVVKEFVDENRDDGNASYSLGMLYPRRVFSENDMGKTLLELSLDDRANLILVTSSSMQRTSPTPESIRTRAASSDATSSDTSGGFWKILSYLNPLSYFSGSSSDTGNSESRSSSWQYEPDPRLRNSFGQGSESRGPLRPDVNEANTSTGKKTPQGRKWGGNVHTLEHNDNEEAFKRGNAFWNGNSTQYGGDDSKK